MVIRAALLSILPSRWQAQVQLAAWAAGGQCASNSPSRVPADRVQAGAERQERALLQAGPGEEEGAQLLAGGPAWRCSGAATGPGSRPLTDGAGGCSPCHYSAATAGCALCHWLGLQPRPPPRAGLLESRAGRALAHPLRARRAGTVHTPCCFYGRRRR